MHECDALSGWCINKNQQSYIPKEYDFWYTENELKLIAKYGDGFLTVNNRNQENKEDSIKKNILKECSIDPITGNSMNEIPLEQGYSCAYTRGICTKRGKYSCIK